VEPHFFEVPSFGGQFSVRDYVLLAKETVIIKIQGFTLSFSFADHTAGGSFFSL
jgi:hypothetical protein